MNFRMTLSTLVAVVLVGGCPASAATVNAWTTAGSGGSLASAVLTQDGTGHYSPSRSNGSITVTNPGAGGNQREVVWPATQPAMLDAQVCATWQSATSDEVQEGVALRITTSTVGTRALTVTKNVIYGAYWAFNVHAWDSSKAQPFTALGQVELGPVTYGPDGVLPLPWRMCAKVVDAALMFKVWLPQREGEPAWGDTSHGGVVMVPPEYVVPGRVGWYAGHLPVGGQVVYSGLGVWGYA